jgi:hypothetical protein
MPTTITLRIRRSVDCRTRSRCIDCRAIAKPFYTEGQRNPCIGANAERRGRLCERRAAWRSAARVPCVPLGAPRRDPVHDARRELGSGRDRPACSVRVARLTGQSLLNSMRSGGGHSKPPRNILRNESAAGKRFSAPTDHETSGAGSDDGSWALSGKTIRKKRRMSAYASDIQRFLQRRTALEDWPV